MPFGFVGYLNINEGCNTCNLVLIFLVLIFLSCVINMVELLGTGYCKNWQWLIICLLLVGVWFSVCLGFLVHV